MAEKVAGTVESEGTLSIHGKWYTTAGWTISPIEGEGILY